ncbi:MAG: 50S ribosomal protein L25 [Planctomycetes bacterium]|nr:50S ribosomal protein L25 [Planctomycetota bacterium]
MSTPTLKARARTEVETGTRACRKLRNQGEVPANLYSVVRGETTELKNRNLAVSAYDLYKLIDRRADILDLEVEGTVQLVRVSEVQRDTFGDDVLHIDMRTIDPDALVEATIKLMFSGKPEGISDMALVTLNVRELTIACKPREIPGEIPVDLALAKAGEIFMSGSVPLPAGCTLIGEEVALATVGKSAGA